MRKRGGVIGLVLQRLANGELEMLAILVGQPRLRQFGAHGAQVLGRKAEGLQIGQAPPDLATARIQLQAAPIGVNRALLVAGRLQGMAIAHPDARVLGIFVEDRGIQVDGRGIVANPTQHDRLQVAVTGVAGFDRQQGIDFGKRLRGLVGPVQDEGVVLARGMESRGQLQAARQQALGILVAAQADRHFGEHADCRDIGRSLLQALAQQCLSLDQAILAERRGRAQHVRVTRRIAHMVGIRRIGTVGVVQGHELIAKREPGLGQIGFQLDCTQQCRLCLPGLPGRPQGESELQVGDGPVRLRQRQRAQDLQCPCGIAAHAMRCSKQEHRLGMRADGLDDFTGLLAGELGIARQQPRGVGKRGIEIRGGFGGDAQSQLPAEATHEGRTGIAPVSPSRGFKLMQQP